MITSGSQNPQSFDPVQGGAQLFKVFCLACRKQVETFTNFDHGIRCYSLGINIITQVMIGLAAYSWGGWGLKAYWTVFNFLTMGHFIYRLTLTEEEMPDTHYSGLPLLIYTGIIPTVEFDNKKRPHWFPKDTEIFTKLIIHPALCILLGYIIFDVADGDRLGLYLMFLGLGSFGATCLQYRDDLEQYYDELDIKNRGRYMQRSEQDNVRHKGFKAVTSKNAPKEDKIKGLTESEIKAKLAATETKAQSQAPPAEADTEPTASSNPAPTPTSTSPEIIIFDENEVAPASSSTGASNGNGLLPKAPIVNAVKAVKPPKSKIYPK